MVSSTTGPFPGPSNRVQKTKRKSVSNNRNPATLEKAIKAAEEAEHKVKNTQAKSCCGSTQQPVTTGSSNTSPAPTTGGNSPDSHDDGPPPSESACCGSKRSSEPEDKPLNIQLETRKQTMGHSSSAQVQGWKHMTVDGTSAPRTIVEETLETKGSCCGGRKAANEAPYDQGNQKLSLSTPKDLLPQPQSQPTDSVGSRIQPGQPPFGHSQPYPYYGAQQHLVNPVQGNSYPNARPTAMNYATNSGSSDQYAPYYPFALGSQLSNGYSNGVPEFHHNCTCGDACACLGCAVHPRNETTVRYLQDVTNFMIQDPFYADPSSPSYSNDQIQYQPSYQIAESSGSGNHTWQGPKLGQSYQPHSTFKHPGTPYSQDVSGSSLWQSRNGSSAGSVHATPTTELSQFSFQGPQNDQGVAQREKTNFQDGQLHYQQPSAYEPTVRNTHFATPDPAPTATTAETPTLSPSSFFWQQVELPGCDDASGACRCGDGCQCVGCLTHGGHDGVPLPQANGDFQNGAAFSPQLERAQMNSIDVTLDTKPGG